MANALHSAQQPLDGIHGLVAYLYPSNADMLSHTNEINGKPTPLATDIHKVAYDGSDYYVLVNHSPLTWQILFSSSGIGIDRFVLSANRNASSTGIYLRNNNNVPTNVTPLVLPYNCKLVAMSAACSVAATWTAEVHLAGSLVAGSTLLVSSAVSAYRNDLTINFNAGDGIQLYLNGTSISIPNIAAFFERR